MSPNTENFLLPEHRYITQLLFQEFLGIPFIVSQDDSRSSLRITLPGDKSRSLVIKNILSPFQNDGTAIPWDHFRLRCSAPAFYGLVLSTEENNLPIISSGVDDRQCAVYRKGNDIILDFDLLTTAFYILARVEEIVVSDRDVYGRFPATASHAYINNYLHRPVVNEMLEILWQCIRILWPGMKRKRRQFRIKLTHDIDNPFTSLSDSSFCLVRSLLGDVFKRKNPIQSISRVKHWTSMKYFGDIRQNPAYILDVIMDIGEKNGVKDDFFFISQDRRNSHVRYDIADCAVRNLIKHINRRGHCIGYHGSYESYKDQILMQSEVCHLKEVASSMGIEQKIWGGRQHWLRWEAPTTWRNYSLAGLDYDTTLTYAEQAGFRCGICYPFPVFDAKERRPLDLWEYPLLVMEVSVLAERYMNLTFPEAYNYILAIKNSCRKYSGCFAILWHPEFINHSVEYFQLYKEILSA